MTSGLWLIVLIYGSILVKPVAFSAIHTAVFFLLSGRRFPVRCLWSRICSVYGQNAALFEVQASQLALPRIPDRKTVSALISGFAERLEGETFGRLQSQH